MSLTQKIYNDLNAAMKAKDTPRVSCLRMLKNVLKNLEKENKRELNDREVEAIISSSIRKSKEAIEEFSKGEREDLALKEAQETEILYGYLPQQLAPEEIETIVKEVIEELSAKSSRDFGKVMKTAMTLMAGRAQGKDVNDTVKKLLK